MFFCSIFNNTTSLSLCPILPALYNKKVMDEIDKIYTKRPFYGRPKITYELKKLGYCVNHKRVRRLMRIMGIQSVSPKPYTSRPAQGHKIYPYLLEDVKPEYPDHIWGVDITYIRMKKEWMYLVAILDWYSRYIVSYEVSDTLKVEFCCEALEKALQKAMPKYHNSDQGSHFTSQAYQDILKRYDSIQISMDHKGCWFDNIFTERLWRTIKYEEVHLKQYENPREVRRSLREYITFYNNERPHSSLNHKTPIQVYAQKNDEVI
jgi:putative transposase